MQPDPPPPRPWWRRADGLVVALLVTVFVIAVSYAIDGVKPWETKWESRVAEGKIPGLRDMTESAWWVAAVANAVISAVLLGLAPWWVRRGGEEAPLTRLRFRPEGAGRSGKVFWWVLLGIVILGTAGPVARLPMGLWGDEEWAFRDFVHGEWLPEDGKKGNLQGPMEFRPNDWRRTLFYNHGGNNHILFSALNRSGQELWRSASGKPRDHYSERWAKWFPALPFGIATLVLLAAFIRWLGAPAVGLLATALYALHPLALRFASEARSYSMVTAFSIAAVWFALRACERSRWRDWALLALIEFLALVTWSAALYPMLALNFFVLLILFKKRGGFRGASMGRWLVTGAFAAMAFLPIYGPHVPQVQRATGTDGMAGAPMNSQWLADTTSRLTTGMLYHESQPDNEAQIAFTERAKTSPMLMKVVPFAVVGAFLIGCMALARRHGMATPIVIAPLLALPLAYALHAFYLHVELRFWYKIYAYPFFYTAVAAGVVALAEELPAGVRKRAIPVFSVIAALGFAWLVGPAYISALKFPYEDLRESVALTRGQHEPLPPAGMDTTSDVVTVRLWRQAPLYDPRARDARTGEQLQALIDDSRAKNRELYLTTGLYNFVVTSMPGIGDLLQDPAVFEKIAVLPSDDPLFTLHVFQLIQKQ